VAEDDGNEDDVDDGDIRGDDWPGCNAVVRVCMRDVAFAWLNL